MSKPVTSFIRILSTGPRLTNYVTNEGRRKARNQKEGKARSVPVITRQAEELYCDRLFQSFTRTPEYSRCVFSPKWILASWYICLYSVGTWTAHPFGRPPVIRSRDLLQQLTGTGRQQEETPQGRTQPTGIDLFCRGGGDSGSLDSRRNIRLPFPGTSACFDVFSFCRCYPSCPLGSVFLVIYIYTLFFFFLLLSVPSLLFRHAHDVISDHDRAPLFVPRCFLLRCDAVPWRFHLCLRETFFLALSFPYGFIWPRIRLAISRSGAFCLFERGLLFLSSLFLSRLSFFV